MQMAYSQAGRSGVSLNRGPRSPARTEAVGTCLDGLPLRPVRSPVAPGRGERYQCPRSRASAHVWTYPDVHRD